MVSFVLKLYVGDELFSTTINVPSLADFTFERFTETVRDLAPGFRISRLTWRDVEGELVTLQNGRHLAEALQYLHRVNGTDFLRIHATASTTEQTSHLDLPLDTSGQLRIVSTHSEASSSGQFMPGAAHSHQFEEVTARSAVDTAAIRTLEDALEVDGCRVVVKTEPVIEQMDESMEEMPVKAEQSGAPRGAVTASEQRSTGQSQSALDEAGQQLRKAEGSISHAPRKRKGPIVTTLAEKKSLNEARNTAPPCHQPSVTPERPAAQESSATGSKNHKSKFEVGDLVFAKVKFYPPWPARIEDPNDAENDDVQPIIPNTKRFLVFFFGTYDVAFCLAKDMIPFEEGRQRFGIPRKDRGFNEALWQIENSPHISRFIDSDRESGDERSTVDKGAIATPSRDDTHRVRGSEKRESETSQAIDLGDKVDSDSNEITYCICNKGVDDDDMIACDGNECSVEWFHYSCVGIKAKPKGKWFCSSCSEKRKKR